MNPLEQALELIYRIKEHCEYYFSNESPDRPTGYVDACWDVLKQIEDEGY